MKAKPTKKEISIWKKHAPPLPDELNRLKKAFYDLFPIVHFCPHLDSKAKFPQDCTHEEHRPDIGSWECHCCQTRRFRNIFGRYLDFLYGNKQLPTDLTGTKIKNRAYGFNRRNQHLYFKIRRHPSVDRDYYMETEQEWDFNLDTKQLALLGEEKFGECYH